METLLVLPAVFLLHVRTFGKVHEGNRWNVSHCIPVEAAHAVPHQRSPAPLRAEMDFSFGTAGVRYIAFRQGGRHTSAHTQCSCLPLAECQRAFATRLTLTALQDRRSSSKQTPTGVGKLQFKEENMLHDHEHSAEAAIEGLYEHVVQRPPGLFLGQLPGARLLP